MSKLVWNKETKNEANEYYRDQTWLDGMEVDDSFSKSNFTEIAPTTIYCNWVTDNWVVDTTAKDHADGLAELAASDIDTIRVLEDIMNALDSEGIMSKTKLTQYAQDKLTARAASRAKL